LLIDRQKYPDEISGLVGLCSNKPTLALSTQMNFQMNFLNSGSRLPQSPIAKICKLTLTLTFGLLATTIDAQQVDVWIGTSGADGIFHLKLNTANGKLTQPRSVSKIPSSGFLAMHPTKEVLYSTGRQGNKNGIAAFSIGHSATKQDSKPKPKNPRPDNNPSELTQISFVETGDGKAACVSVDKTGRVAMSAQYSGGSVSTYQLAADGAIKNLVDAVEHGAGSGVEGKRQKASHPHWVGTSPDNQLLLVPDLGKDATVVYRLDLESGKIQKHVEVASPPGAGPRHMKFHTSGKYAYVLNELSMSVSVFEFDADNASFTKLQEIVALPEELKDEQLHSAAEIRVHPGGKFVYTSNRGHDSITVFAVEQESGKLNFVQRESIRGAWPRNFNIDPSGKWLLAAGQRTNTLALFSIDEETGKLAYARKSVNVPAPICVLFGK